jgi:polysaccharide biosynthesis/export protein
VIKKLLNIFALVGMLTFALAAPAVQEKTDYQLGAGDSIRITVFQNPDLTLETRVSEAGSITYPLIGTIQVSGLSAAAAEQLVAQKLMSGNFVKKPQVNITLLEVRGSQASVMGLVNKPGRFPLDTSTRLSELIAMAGGVIPDASDVAIVIGKRDGQAFRKEVDLPSIFLNSKNDDDILIAAGDEVYVQRAPMFYIYGEAQKPGSYRIERNMTVMQALAQGGGPSVRGTQRNIKLLRHNSNGTTEELHPKMTDLVRPNDVLYVRESLF